MHRLSRAGTLACLLLGLGGGPLMAHAQENSREKDALRRLQQAVGKLQGEKAQWEQEKNQLADKLKAATDQQLQKSKAQAEKEGKQQQARELALRETQRQLAIAQKETAELRAKLAEAQQQSGVVKAKLDTVSKQGTELGTALAAVRDDKRRGDGQLAQTVRELGSCDLKNGTLYKLNLEILERYRKKGMWDGLLQKDPLLGLKTVEIENVLEEYRDKIEQQRLREDDKRTLGKPEAPGT